MKVKSFDKFITENVENINLEYFSNSISLQFYSDSDSDYKFESLSKLAEDITSGKIISMPIGYIKNGISKEEYNSSIKNIEDIKNINK